MKPDELKKIREAMERLRAIRELQSHLKKIKELNRRHKIARQFFEENKELLRNHVSSEEMDLLRESCGYDEKAWQEILRQLQG